MSRLSLSRKSRVGRLRPIGQPEDARGRPDDRAEAISTPPRNYDWTRVGIERPGSPPYAADFCRTSLCGWEGGLTRATGTEPAPVRHRVLQGRCVVGEDRGCYIYEAARTGGVAGVPELRPSHAVHDGRLFVECSIRRCPCLYGNPKPLGNLTGRRIAPTKSMPWRFIRGASRPSPEGRVAMLKREEWVDCGRLRTFESGPPFTTANYGGTIREPKSFATMGKI